MIPNAGLDNAATYKPWSALTGSFAESSGDSWMSFAAISEDSSAPSATDTGIGSEKMRTSGKGGFSRSATAIRDPGTNRLGVALEIPYVFNIVTNLNITKYGYVPLSTGGNFTWIDLTRADPDDPGSAPIVLTVVNGDQLQLFATLTITVPWSIDLESFVITGTAGNDAAGMHDAYCGFYATSVDLSGYNSLDNIIAGVMWPNNAGYQSAWISGTPNTARDASIGSSGAASGGGTNPTLETYTSGTYTRDKTYFFSTAQGVGAITAINLTTGIQTRGGYGFKIVFNDPATFVKDNTHTLSLTFRVSWAEA